MARRFFAPVLVSGVEDASKGTVDIHVTNDRRKAFTGTLRWTLTTVSGDILATDRMRVRVRQGENSKITRLDVSDVVSNMGARDLLVWLALEDRGTVISRNLVTFVRPKQMALEDPGLSVKVTRPADGAFLVTLSARRPALYVWLALPGCDARFGDNFLDVMPGERVHIEAAPGKAMTLAAFKKKLRVRSLLDTF
jgi:beta-mannosidase